MAELIARAGGESELPDAERVRRTLDGYPHYAEHHHAAYRTIVTGGVGSNAEVLAIREADREEPVATIAEGAYGHRTLPPIARLALVGWLSAVEGITLEWIGGPRAPDGHDRVDEPGRADEPGRTHQPDQPARPGRARGPAGAPAAHHTDGDRGVRPGVSGTSRPRGALRSAW
ncbi:hypothetical protein [Streptomyces sp. NPDC054849]